MSLPKDMQLRVPKGQEWFGLYHWMQIPHEEPQKENKAMNQEHANSDIKPVLKSTKAFGNAQTDRSVKFVDEVSSPVTKAKSKTQPKEEQKVIE